MIQPDKISRNRAQTGPRRKSQRSRFRVPPPKGVHLPYLKKVESRDQAIQFLRELNSPEIRIVENDVNPSTDKSFHTPSCRQEAISFLHSLHIPRIEKLRQLESPKMSTTSSASTSQVTTAVSQHQAQTSQDSPYGSD